MITVYKYRLERATRQIIVLPRKAKILTVAFQGNELFLWAQIDTDNPSVERSIHIYGTGHEHLDEDLIYLGTAMLLLPNLVFHVYENPPL